MAVDDRSVNGTDIVRINDKSVAHGDFIQCDVGDYRSLFRWAMAGIRFAKARKTEDAFRNA